MAQIFAYLCPLPDGQRTCSTRVRVSRACMFVATSANKPCLMPFEICHRDGASCRQACLVAYIAFRALRGFFFQALYESIAWICLGGAGAVAAHYGEHRRDSYPEKGYRTRRRHSQQRRQQHARAEAQKRSSRRMFQRQTTPTEGVGEGDGCQTLSSPPPNDKVR